MKNVIRLFLFVFFSVTAINVHAQNDGDSSSSKWSSPNNSSSNYGTAAYSNPVSMAGWHLESNPKVINSERETGKVVYAIEIDSVGDLLSIKVLEKTISEELTRKCKDEIRKMVFIKNRNNTSTASTSKGTITFIFRVD